MKRRKKHPFLDYQSQLNLGPPHFIQKPLNHYKEKNKDKKQKKLRQSGSKNPKTHQRVRILKNIKTKKIQRENVFPLEQAILDAEQYDRKVREIEIRSKNLRLRREREIRLQIARGETVVPSGYTGGNFQILFFLQ